MEDTDLTSSCPPTCPTQTTCPPTRLSTATGLRSISGYKCLYAVGQLRRTEESRSGLQHKARRVRPPTIRLGQDLWKRPDQPTYLWAGVQQQSQEILINPPINTYSSLSLLPPHQSLIFPFHLLSPILTQLYIIRFKSIPQFLLFTDPFWMANKDPFTSFTTQNPAEA